MSIKIISIGPSESCDSNPCCEGDGCCMYPASALDVDYTIDDLPDTVVTAYFDGNGNRFEKTFTRLEAPVPFSDGFAYYSTGEFEIGSGDENIIVLEDLDPLQWTNYNQGAGQINGIGLCLIQKLDPPATLPESFGFAAEFEDTYTVTTPFSSGTVTRQALCNWSGVDGNGCPLELIYGGFESDPETEPAEGGLKWSVSFFKFESPVEGQPEVCIVSYGRLKSGFQNSPTGTYDIPYASEGPELATVS